MNLPGFTAENSLTPAAATYFGGHSLSAASEDLVQPEFLGVIKELFEKAGSALSQAVQSAASAIGNMISNINKSGGQGGRPFVCNQWATAVLACRNGQPAFNQAEIVSRCVSANPAYMVGCSAVSVAMYPLLQKACSESPNQVGNLIGQICKG